MALPALAVVGALDADHHRQAQFSRDDHRSRSRTFFCSRAKNDSIALLSRHAPTRHILMMTTFRRRRISRGQEPNRGGPHCHMVLGIHAPVCLPLVVEFSTGVIRLSR